MFTFLSKWFKHFEFTAQRVVYLHYCSVVVEFSTVVGRREDCHKSTISVKLKSVLHYLVSAADQV